MNCRRRAVAHQQVRGGQIQRRLQHLVLDPHPLIAFNVPALTSLCDGGSFNERDLQDKGLKSIPWRDGRTDHVGDHIRREFKGAVGFLPKFPERSLRAGLPGLGPPSEVPPGLSPWGWIERQKVDG